MSATTLSRLAELPELRTRGRRTRSRDLLVLLAAGPTAVTTVEALDRPACGAGCSPNRGAVRDLPPRDVVHIWTVDRHLIETVSRASAFTTRVSRPDLLVLGALLHDIGKGRGGDHSVIGADLATRSAPGWGCGRRTSNCSRRWCVITCCWSRPPPGATCRIRRPSPCGRRARRDPVLLELLHVLAEAGLLATGPGVWGDWKSPLIGDLVRRCRLVMAGEPLPHADPVDPSTTSRWPPTGRARRDGSRGQSAHLQRHDDRAGPSGSAVQGRRCGALNSLRVHSASVNSADGSAIDTFAVSPHFGCRRPPSCCASSSSGARR